MGCASSISRTSSSGAVTTTSPEPPEPNHPPEGSYSDEWHYDVLDYFVRKRFQRNGVNTMQPVANPLQKPLYAAWTNGKMVLAHTSYETFLLMSPETYNCLVEMEKFLIRNRPASAPDGWYEIYWREIYQPAVVVYLNTSRMRSICEATELFPFVTCEHGFSINQHQYFIFNLKLVLQVHFGLTQTPAPADTTERDAQFRMDTFPTGLFGKYAIGPPSRARGRSCDYPCRVNTSESEHTALFSPLPNPARERYLEYLPVINNSRRT